MNLGMIAVFLVIIIVIGSILTRKCEPFLIGGSIAGAVFLYRQNFLPQWVTILENVMSSEAYLILVCGLFGSIIALLTASKGNYGFSKLVSRLCNTERKTLITTVILGIVIFIDDYLNMLKKITPAGCSAWGSAPYPIVWNPFITVMRKLLSVYSLWNF